MKIDIFENVYRPYEIIILYTWNNKEIQQRMQGRHKRYELKRVGL